MEPTSPVAAAKRLWEVILNGRWFADLKERRRCRGRFSTWCLPGGAPSRRRKRCFMQRYAWVRRSFLRRRRAPTVATGDVTSTKTRFFTGVEGMGLSNRTILESSFVATAVVSTDVWNDAPNVYCTRAGLAERNSDYALIMVDSDYSPNSKRADSLARGGSRAWSVRISGFLLELLALGTGLGAPAHLTCARPNRCVLLDSARGHIGRRWALAGVRGVFVLIWSRLPCGLANSEMCVRTDP